jgi:protein TonB
VEVVGSRDLSTLESALPIPKKPILVFEPLPVPTPEIEWQEPPPPPIRPRPPAPEVLPDPPLADEIPPIRKELPSTPAPASTTGPVAIDNPPPDYPEDALRRGQEGLVMILARICPEGRPLEVTVLRSSGYGTLDRAARAAVLRWAFRPATRDGRPVEGEVEIPIRFRLSYR